MNFFIKPDTTLMMAVEKKKEFVGLISSVR